MSSSESFASPSQNKESCLVYKTGNFEKDVDALSNHLLNQFYSLKYRYLFFHLISLLLISILIWLFPNFLLHTALTPLLVAAFVLVLSSYGLLSLYYHAKKRQQLREMVGFFLKQCAQSIDLPASAVEHHFSLSHATYHILNLLRPPQFSPPTLLKRYDALTLLIQKALIWLFWRDLLLVKEKLLHEAIENHIALIKNHPTDLEVHASLAKNYKILAGIYKNPCKLLSSDPHYIPAYYRKERMQPELERVLRRAVEEYCILASFAPQDPWVSAELAALYAELNMVEEEIAQYEKLVSLTPEENAPLFRLGLLYFKQGSLSKGLTIYDQLKKRGYAKAEELISFYDLFPLKESATRY